MNRFKALFPKGKPIIAMVHLKPGGIGTQARAEREIDLFYRCGVDAVIVENYFGDAVDCENALKYLQAAHPDKPYGVNILGDLHRGFQLADEYGAGFVQVDSVCGHLHPKADEKYAEMVNAMREKSHAALLGGVRFKYQAVKSRRLLAEDLRLGMMRCDGVVVTGEGTAMPTPQEKQHSFRAVLGDFPLIVGAGVTAESIAATMRFADGAIIGSWFKEGHDARGEVVEEYVRTIVTNAKSF